MGGTRQPAAAQELGGRRDGARLGMQEKHWQPVVPPRVLLETYSSGPDGRIVFVFIQPISKHLPSLNLSAGVLTLFSALAVSCSAGLWPCKDGGRAPIRTWCLFLGGGKRDRCFPGHTSILCGSGGRLPSSPPGSISGAAAEAPRGEAECAWGECDCKGGVGMETPNI